MARNVKLRRGLPVTTDEPDYPELDINNQVQIKNVKNLVPYTGAATNVDLGAKTLTTAKLSAGGPDTMVVNGATVTSQIEANSDTLAVVESHTHSNTAAAASTFYHARSRGTTDSPSAVQNGDLLGVFAAVGYDGTDYAAGGYIVWAVSGTPGSNDMPTEFSVWTTPDGAQTPVKNFSIGPTGAAAFTADVTVPDEVYGAGWNGSLEVPTKNAVYDKIESLGSLTAMRQNYFGNGGDGDLTINSGTTTITVPRYYNNVTISGTASLVSSGAFIFVKGTLDLTNAPAAAITWAPVNGGSAVNSNGAAGGTALPANYLPGSQAGGKGGNGGTTTGTQAAAVAANNPAMMLSNAAASGGKGGSGSSGAGGAARAATAPTSFWHITWREMVFAQWTGAGWSTIKGGAGAPGGSGGGGDGTAGGGGGGGGGGAGQLWINASVISRGGSTAASAIKCVGGNGGNGFSAAAGNRGGGGGGCGAGGGWIYILYGSLSGSTATGCIDASGGNGGNGGAKSGTGTDGDGGYGGIGGIVVVQPITGAATVTTGSAPVANSGRTGGTGEQLKVDL